MNKPRNFDEYIAGFPSEIQKLLEQIRETVKRTAPAAEETISYGMPTFTLDGKYLIYFSAYKKHIGVYPVPTGHKGFDKVFSAYKTSGKGAIQFPLDQPIPLDLLESIVRFRVKENAKQIKVKK